MSGLRFPRSRFVLLDAGADTIVVEADGHGTGGARGGRAGHQLTRGILDQGVAAGQRALRVVRGERQPEAVEVPDPPSPRAFGAPLQVASAPAQAGGAALVVARDP